MKLIIIRHADPDYAIDSLTQKGWREARLLAKRISALTVKEFYVSPLGRARDTANTTLERLGRTAQVLPWLREFHAPIFDEKTQTERIPWDWLPQDWTKQKEFYDRELWNTHPMMQAGEVGLEAASVAKGLDEILEKHGYRREGNLYQVLESNNDTIVFYCHFGVECIMLGHLLGISPMVLWHGMCAAPSSVTTLVTEERREGVACFRMSSFGDISHLYAGGEEPSFAARFCESYQNSEERHD